MDLSHINERFRDVAVRSKEDRIAFLDEERWIGYTQADAIIDMMRSLMEKPKKPRMPNILIVGDSNNGKSTVIERFKKLYGESYVNGEGDAVIPVLVAESPTPDEKGLYAAILEEFLTPYRTTDSAAKLRYQVIHLMRDCHVRILIIEELHSLLAGTAMQQRLVMNVLKFLCNELCIPVVGVGTRDAVRVLHTDPQHASRFDVVKLPTWEMDKEFRRILQGIEQILPLRFPSNLSDREKAPLLLSISEGNLGNLRFLLNECAKEAIQSGQEYIDLEIIKSKSWVRPTRGIREVVL
jgi:hypothetical protein